MKFETNKKTTDEIMEEFNEWFNETLERDGMISVHQASDKLCGLLEFKPEPERWEKFIFDFEQSTETQR